MSINIQIRSMAKGHLHSIMIPMEKRMQFDAKILELLA